MKWITAVLALLLLHQPAWAQDSEARAREIIDEAARRTAGFQDFTAKLTMTIRDADGAGRDHEMQVQVLEVPEDGQRTLLTFDRANVRGMMILTIANRDGRRRQYVYLPSTRSTREVATSRQSESFMGSDFTYRDMGAQDFHGYTYEYLGEETVGQVSCHKLERRPTDDGSGYDHQVVWLDTEAYRVLRVDYFDGANELLKTLELDGYQQYAGRHWRPDRMVMTDSRSGKSTTLAWSEYSFENGLTTADFDPRRLGRPR
mgnify:FL=1|jgi:outer membrane lipoprotein-sorting protein